MLTIYTDMSRRHNVVATSCLILSTKNFLGYNVRQHEGVDNSIVGELVGIADGLDYAVQSGCVHDGDKVVICCDSQPTLSMLETARSKSIRPKRYVVYIDDVLDRCRGLNVTFQYIKGHQLDHNPNKIVDLSSNTSLRYSSLLNTQVQGR